MAKLRVEFTTVGGARGRLGGQIDLREAEPLGSSTLEVGTSTTPVESRPAVPSGRGTVFAELVAVDAPIYVDVAASPDPSAEPRLLLLPGRPQRVHVLAGQTIAALIATSDLPFASDLCAIALTDRSGAIAVAGTAQQACAANTSRRILLVANPDGANTFWFRTDAAATSGAGSVQVGPGGAFVFDKVVPSGAVSVLGSVSGQPFTVKEA